MLWFQPQNSFYTGRNSISEELEWINPNNNNFFDLQNIPSDMGGFSHRLPQINLGCVLELLLTYVSGPARQNKLAITRP